MKKKNLYRINMKSIDFTNKVPSIVFGRKHTLKLNFNQGLIEKQLSLFKTILKKVNVLTFEADTASLGLNEEEIMDLRSITLEEIRFNRDEFVKTNCTFTMMIDIIKNSQCTLEVDETFYDIMDRHFDLKD